MELYSNTIQSFLKFYLESMQRPEIAAAILTTCVHREVSDDKAHYTLPDSQFGARRHCHLNI